MRIPSLDLTLARVFASSVKLKSVSELYFTLDATCRTHALPRSVEDTVPGLRVRQANPARGVNEWMGQGEGLDASRFAAAAASGWSLWMLAAR